MNFKNIIRQLIAAFLLLIFAFGATPKKFLHDAVTQHKHEVVVKCSHHHINISAVSFNCQIDNLVVEMPFVAALQHVFDFVSIQYFQFNQATHNKIISANGCVAYLRGPPAC